MPTGIDITGKCFGRLTVVEKVSLPEPHEGRATAWKCVCECGDTVVRFANILRRQVAQGHLPSCGKRCSARTRKYVNKQGYVLLHRPEHPNSYKSGRLLEHVSVITEHIGRPLLPGENVHHRNGVRDDNRIENLELWSTSQPAGQRVEDKTVWAIEWLQQYAPEVLK